MDVTFGMEMLIKVIQSVYDYDLDELTMKEFVDKIKTDESLQEYGENLDLFMENNGEDW